MSPVSIGGSAPARATPANGNSYRPSSSSNTEFDSSSNTEFDWSVPSPIIQQVTVVLAGTPYYALPPDFRRAFDQVHEAIMCHKRTIHGNQHGAALASLGASTRSTKQLQETITQLGRESPLEALTHACKDEYETLYRQGIQALWTVESLANHRGVHLKAVANPPTLQDTSFSIKAQVQTLLAQQMAQVDRVERMPSLYFWQFTHDLKERLTNLERCMWSVQQKSRNNHALDKDGPFNTSKELFRQMQQVTWAMQFTQQLQLQTNHLRNLYRFYEKGENVLDLAHYKEQTRERQLNDLIRHEFVKVAAPVPTPTAPAPTTPAPTTAPTAPAGGGFGTPTGTSAPDPAPAPATAFWSNAAALGVHAPAPVLSAPSAPTSSTPLWASAPSSTTSGFPAPAPVTAPAPSVGSAPAPAPAFGSGYGYTSFAPALVTASAPPVGSAPVPAPTPSFGYNGLAPAPVTAPAPPVGSAPAPAPTPSFGSAPVTASVPPVGSAPAPASTPSFGYNGFAPAPPVGSAPAPAPTPSFGSGYRYNGFASVPVTAPAPPVGSVTAPAPAFGSGYGYNGFAPPPVTAPAPQVSSAPAPAPASTSSFGSGYGYNGFASAPV